MALTGEERTPETRSRMGSAEGAIFGLSQAQLQPIVERVAGEPVAQFEVRVEHEVGGEHYGFSGDKVIPTFTYTTRSGRWASTTVFVKRAHEPAEHTESMHYAAMARLGAPIPTCYGALTLSPADEREILFLEHVRPVPDYRPYDRFVLDEARYRQFLSVTARLDALVPPPDYARWLPHGSPHELYGGSADRCLEWFDRLWSDARAGKLGADLAGLCTDRALESMRRLPGRLATLEFPPPLHLWHDCWEPCHTGWRHITGEMVILDLQPMGLGPRFANVSPWLGQPDEIQPRCRPARELAAFYLDEYVRHGGEAVPVDRFLAEARAQWLCEAVCLVNRWQESVLAGEARGMLFHLVRFLLYEG